MITEAADLSKRTSGPESKPDAILSVFTPHLNILEDTRVHKKFPPQVCVFESSELFAT